MQIQKVATEIASQNTCTLSSMRYNATIFSLYDVHMPKYPSMISPAVLNSIALVVVERVLPDIVDYQWRNNTPSI